MSFPLTFDDATLFLAAVSLILLITSQMLSPNFGKINIRIDRKKLKGVAYAITLLFLTIVVIRIISLILTS